MTRRVPDSSAAFADTAAIAGIGATEFARRGGITDRTEFALLCEAIRKAADDAGISTDEIDGFSSYATERHEPVLVQAALGMPELRWSNMVWGAGGGGSTASLMNAAMAVHAGLCNYVVCYRSLCQGQYERFGQYRPRPTAGSFMAPFGLMSPAQMTALTFRRHMHVHDTPVEALGHIAVTLRDYAARNPAALMRTPLSLAEHAASRRIADPFRLYDCCLETDGAAAVIVTSRERARDLRRRPARILAAAQASGDRWGLGPMGSHNMPIETYHSINARETGRILFGMAGMSPSDLDVAQIYDAFTGVLLMGLEDYGICEPGGAAEFVMSGGLGPEGKLPTNTAGGLLSEGYLQGFNLILEGVRQIRGDSTSQVADAETCLVTSGGGQAHKSAMILAV
ncbi:thiolase C-terminal domain-containing protein [Salipiger sp.]|uniref:thiolase C-terminal domain-containing protein n=1 Tax=Salipiger sp. TaxID=2078585 RepID=UPI003A979717